MALQKKSHGYTTLKAHDQFTLFLHGCDDGNHDDLWWCTTQKQLVNHKDSTNQGPFQELGRISVSHVLGLLTAAFSDRESHFGKTAVSGNLDQLSINSFLAVCWPPLILPHASACRMQVLTVSGSWSTRWEIGHTWAPFFLTGNSFQHGNYLSSNDQFLDSLDDAGFIFVSSEVKVGF